MNVQAAKQQQYVSSDEDEDEIRGNVQDSDEEISGDEDSDDEAEVKQINAGARNEKEDRKGDRKSKKIQQEDDAPVAKKARVERASSASSSSSTEDLSETKESGPVYCSFDLETTSLHNPDLTQISAQTLNGKHTFNVYILPDKEIDFKASQITGIRKINNQLHVRGTIVETVDIAQALTMFADWLNSFGNDVVLVGHNIRKFDMVHLSRHVKAHNLTSQFKIVISTLDTALLFANIRPYSRPHSLANMYKMCFQTTFHGAHGAVEDCRAVARILNEGRISEEKKKQFTQRYSF